MAGKTFINYRRGDDAGYTHALYLRLESEFGSDDLFMDVEGHIRPGDDFVEVLAAQVAACDVMLVVIGPRWLDSIAARQDDPYDFVALEIQTALDRRKRVVPVLVGGASMPPADKLPNQIRSLAYRNAIALRPERFRADCQGLVIAVNQGLAAAERDRAARLEAERTAAALQKEQEEDAARTAADYAVRESRSSDELNVDASSVLREATPGGAVRLPRRRKLGRLPLIIFGVFLIAGLAVAIAISLTAWKGFQSNFEVKLEELIGHPVNVLGSTDARILPSPSLTFTDVEVGETEGQPMMSVKRLSVTLEFMSLILGDIRVASVKLEEPEIRISIGDTGQVNWMFDATELPDVDREPMTMSGFEISDGTLIYYDARTGSDFSLDGIAATVKANSITGSWIIEGDSALEMAPVHFRVETERRDADSFGVKLDVIHGPIATSANGVVAHGDAGPSYSGTYNLAQITPAIGGDDQNVDANRWRSEGSFLLTGEQIVIPYAIVTDGPLGRPPDFAGSMTIILGPASRFFANFQGSKIDLDHSLGEEEPKKPIEVTSAIGALARWLRVIPVPTVSGTVRISIPNIVVGGAAIEGVSFSASPEDYGWLIEGLTARLPGQTTFAADGRLSTGEAVGFGGNVRLAVGQPATFAAWWRGKSEVGAGRLLSPFDLSGRATVTMSGVSVEDMTTEIGDATIKGSFSWVGAGNGSPLRTLRTNLDADRLDFVQIRALAQLLGGHDLRDTSTIADSFQIKLTAGELLIEELVMRDVSVDAGFENGGLWVSGIDVGDLGGARFVVTRTQIDDILGEPLGRMEAQLTAQTLTGLANVVDRLAPDTPFARWFRDSAPSLAPVSIALTIDSVMDEGRPNSRLDVKGSAKATNFDATVELAGVPTQWRQATLNMTASLNSYDAVGVTHQIGISESNMTLDGGARFRVLATGIPNKGLASELTGSFGGLTLKVAGDVVALGVEPPKFTGTFGVETADLGPLLRFVGLAPFGSRATIPVSLSGNVQPVGASTDFSWTNGAIAGRHTDGSIRLSEAGAEVSINEIGVGQKIWTVGFTPSGWKLRER